MRTLLLASLLAAASLLPAQDDRDRTTPVEHIRITSATAAELQWMASSGWRFTDLDAHPGWFGTTFSGAAVWNTGSYAKAWTWLPAATAAQIQTHIAQNNMRIVDIDPYTDFATLTPLFAVVFVANTGADGKAWWWYHGQTSTQVGALATVNNARLTSLHEDDNGTFTAVMISNTGADARGWGFYFNASAPTIVQLLNSSGGRVYSLDTGLNGYHAVLIDNPQGLTNWYYYAPTTQTFDELMEQNIGRIVDVEANFIALLDNANPLEIKARQAFIAAGAGGLGKYGFLLDEIGSVTRAAMRPATPFEAAGTLATVHHATALRSVAQGYTSLTTQFVKPSSCSGSGGTNQTLGTTLVQMMEQSDSLAALAISNHFGLNGIQITANVLGMADTDVNYPIGCSTPSPFNLLTLADLSSLHVGVHNGFLSPGATDVRPTFYSTMEASLAFPSWGSSDLEARINLHALLIGMSTAAREVFKSKLKIAYKQGSVSWPPFGSATHYCSEGGWMSVPFRNTAGLLAPKEYTFGVFNHGFTGSVSVGRNAMCNAELELVWDRVQAAMSTWDDYVAGSITSIAGAGCPGSAGTPVQTAGSQPDLEETVVYTVDSAPAGTVAIAMFGFSNTSWGGAPLPADLGPIGAPGCVLRTEPSVLFAGLVSGSGTMRQQIVIGTDPATIGVVWYSQFLVFDPPANAFGATLSNALRTQVGGSI